MYAVKSGSKLINDEYIDTYSRHVLTSQTLMEVEAGTNGYHGTPCREGGGRTYMRLESKHGDFFFDPIFNEEGDITGIEIAACGDAGLDALMKALSFAYEAINDARCEVDD